MKQKYVKSIVITSILLLVIATFSGCALFRKIGAAKIILQTKFDYKEVSYDRVEVDPDIMDLVKNGLTGFFPNPKAVALVKDLSLGVIKSELGKAMFNVHLNANNTTKDTLWINDLQIELQFDTLITVPLTLADSMALIPGDNDMHLVAAFPLDMRIFKYNEIRTYAIAGDVNVALQKGGTPVKQDFKIEHTVTPEEVKKIEGLIRDRLFELLVNDWLGSVVK